MIHYHGTPVGGTRTDVVRFLSGRHALIPFARPDDAGAVMDVCQSFVLDNSAFSHWRKGGEVDVAAYHAWVHKSARKARRINRMDPSKFTDGTL